MKDNSKILLALITAVLITSGCMDGESGDASTDGISVNQFEISPDPAPGGQSVNMQMQLENAGSAEATDITANIFGPTIADDDRTWTANDGTVMNFNNLQPATDTQPAIPQQSSLTFTTPGLDEGRNLPYDFSAQIFYGYDTSSSTSLQVMSQERYQDTGAVQEATSVSNSDAPIHLDVQGSTPIVFQPQQGDRTEDLCVTVRNVGSGTPFHPDALPAESSADIEDHDNLVDVEIENVGNIVFLADDDSETSTSSGVETEVEIIGNEGYHCFTMQASGLGDVTQLEQTANIEIETQYGYREETSTSVTVEGRGTGSSDSSTSEEDESDQGDEDEDVEGPEEEPEGMGE